MVSLVAGLIVTIAVVGLARTATTTFYEEARLSTSRRPCARLPSASGRTFPASVSCRRATSSSRETTTPRSPSGRRSRTSRAPATPSRYGALTERSPGDPHHVGGSLATASGAEPPVGRQRAQPRRDRDDRQLHDRRLVSRAHGRQQQPSSSRRRRPGGRAAPGGTGSGQGAPESVHAGLAVGRDPSVRRARRRPARMLALRRHQQRRRHRDRRDADVRAPRSPDRRSSCPTEDQSTCGASDQEEVTVNPVQTVRWSIGPTTPALEPDPALGETGNKFDLLREIRDATEPPCPRRRSAGRGRVRNRPEVRHAASTTRTRPRAAGQPEDIRHGPDSAEIALWTQQASLTARASRRRSGSVRSVSVWRRARQFRTERSRCRCCQASRTSRGTARRRSRPSRSSHACERSCRKSR